MRFKHALLLMILGFIAGLVVPTIYPQYFDETGLAMLELNEISSPIAQTINPNQVQAFACPQDNCGQNLVSFIGSAKESVHIMIYSLTKEDIANAIVEAKENGLDVKVLIDKQQAGNKSAQDEYLLEKSVELKRIGLPGYSIMHNKITIVDGKAFSTGSFNYTNNADTGSAENLVIISNQELAQKFEQEFQKYWNRG